MDLGSIEKRLKNCYYNSATECMEVSTSSLSCVQHPCPCQLPQFFVVHRNKVRTMWATFEGSFLYVLFSIGKFVLIANLSLKCPLMIMESALSLFLSNQSSFLASKRFPWSFRVKL